MQKLTGVIIAVVVCFSVLIPPAMGATAQTTVDVKLTIEQYLEVNIQSDITMTTVNSAYFGHNMQTSGSALVDVYTNIDATLRTLMTTTLTGVGSGGVYTVDVQTTLLGGPNPVYPSGSYWCLDFTPGAYPGQTTVTASLKKTWTAADVADTYTGTITLELVPK